MGPLSIIADSGGISLSSTLYGGDVMLLTSTQDVVDRWKEYFEDLLNPTTRLPVRKQGLWTRVWTLLSLGLRSPRWSGSSSVAGPRGWMRSAWSSLRPWMLWGCHGWHDSAAPHGHRGQCLWIGRLGVSSFKKGDQRVCSNYRGITLLSLPGKVYSGVLERRVRRIVEPLGGSGLVTSGLGHCFLRMMWSCWFHQTVTSNSRWTGSQPSVKWPEWESAPPNPSPWFSTGKGWSAHSGSGMRSCPKWRSSSTSGSCSRVRGGWSGRLTGGSVRRLQ